MKKILIVSYYFYPCNGIPALRATSWANYFHQYGIHPTIVTRHWNGDEKIWNDYIQSNLTPQYKFESQKYTAYYLPFKEYKLPKWVLKVWGLRKLINIFKIIIGNINLDIDAYNCFKDFLFDHLKNHQYDAAIITVPPHNTTHLVQIIQNMFKIPCVLDFRDHWDNNIFNKNYHPTIKRQFFNYLHKYYLKKWARNASCVISISDIFSQHLSKHLGIPGYTINNGFEDGIFTNIESKFINKFTFSVIGTLYPMQDLSIMLEGLKKFLSNKIHNNIQVNFIGVNCIQDVSNKIKHYLPEIFINITDRIPRIDALEIMKNSHVLFYAGWKGSKGIYSGKIFEYLASGRLILIAPGDDDVIDDLIIKTNTGVIANTVDDFVNHLEQWYLIWNEKGDIHAKGIPEEIQKYSRNRQCEELVSIVLKYI